MSQDQPQPVVLESSRPLQGERVAFTGTLASMTHKQAHQLVEEHGGASTAYMSSHVTMLVVGEEGWPLEADGKTSLKLQHGVELINQGHALRILNESDWLRLLGFEQGEREVARLHTPAMLQQLLGVSVSLVRRWERLGLIHAVQRVYRLPYFDFREVAGVRKLQELLEAGVSRSEIESSLAALEHLLPSVKRPIAQLEILERDARLVVRDNASLVDPRSGQRLFDFEPTDAAATSTSEAAPQLKLHSAVDDALEIQPQPNWSTEDWYQQGCRLLDANDATGAIEAFRLSLMDSPSDPELHFQLADALFRANNLQGALERLHVAVEHDHDYIEAWTQMGCLRHILGDSTGALQALDIALAAHPAYPDALYHKASIVAELGQEAEARELWTRYLKFDRRGPWADVARQRLGLIDEAEPASDTTDN